MIEKHLQISSCVFAHKQNYKKSFLQKVSNVRNKSIFVLKHRFGIKPIGYVEGYKETIIIYKIKGALIGKTSHRIGELPFLGIKKEKNYPKPTALEVANAVRYLEKFLTRYGNSIHKLSDKQYKQFRKALDATLLEAI